MTRTDMIWTAAAALLGLTAMVAGTGCHGPTAQAAPPKSTELTAVTVTVAPVQARAVQRKINLVGTLNALETVAISPKVSGLVERVAVDEGDRVKPGELLVEIDRTDYELAVNEAERALQRELAKVGLEQLPDGRFDVEALPSIVRSRALIDNAQKVQDRMRKLVERNATTLQEYEDATTKLHVEQATLKQMQLDVQATLAAARHADSLLSTAKRHLAETKLVAPALLLPGKQDARALGYVVTRRDTATGAMVTPQKTVFELVIDDLLKLKATVPERHAGEVKLGQAVELFIDAYPKEVFKATVSRISPTVDPESRTFAIEAIVANAEHRLKHGAFAKAAIITRADAEAVTVPLEAIVSFAGVTKVFVVKDGKAEGVPVEIGLQGQGWVEVLGDVPPGGTVVTTGQSQLANGTPVTLRQDKPAAEKAPTEQK